MIFCLCINLRFPPDYKCIYGSGNHSGHVTWLFIYIPVAWLGALSSAFLILGALVSGKEETGWCRRAGWTCQQTCSFYRLWDIRQWRWGTTQVFEKSLNRNHYVFLFQFHYFHLMSYTECSSFLSSGLLVVPKVKRRSSRGKGLRRRTQQRRKWTKQQRLAAQMGTAQQRARHQRRVCIQLLSSWPKRISPL